MSDASAVEQRCAGLGGMALLVRELARKTVKLGREAPGLVDEDVRPIVRTLYDMAHGLETKRARLLGIAKPPEPTEGKPTNVGDPNPKGQVRGGKK